MNSEKSYGVTDAGLFSPLVTLGNDDEYDEAGVTCCHAIAVESICGTRFHRISAKSAKKIQ